jgi:signal transduction histidine kinase
MFAAWASSFVRIPRGVWRSAARFGAGVALLLAIGVGGVFGVTYWLTTRALFNSIDSAVAEQLELLSERPPDMLPFMITSRLRHQPAVLTQVALFAADGSLIVGDIERIPAGLRFDARPRIFSVPAAEGGMVRLDVAARTLVGGRHLVVARDVEDLLVFRATLIRILMVSLAACAGLGMAAGTAYAVRGQARLRRLSAAAERIMLGALDERLEVRRRPDAMDELCIVVNRILDRLERLVEAWKNAGENIAHDLRTPLTALRAQLERLRDGERLEERDQLTVNGSLRAIDSIRALTTRLLRIAEIEHHGRTRAFAEVDVAELLREIGDDFTPLAEDAGIALSVEAPVKTVIRGDRELLAEALINLTENAIKYAGSGRHIVLKVQRSDERIIIAVADDGPGIAPTDREQVFRRFYRGRAAQGVAGSGLGLALVASIAGHHGFELRLRDNAPGCRVELVCTLREAAE